MTPRIENAIKVFLNALENGTLAKGHCGACAVGNLIADGLNGLIDSQLNCTIENTGWASLFATSRNIQDVNNLNDFSVKSIIQIKKEIESTDFSQKELMKIEYAFETNTEIDSILYNKHTPEEVRADQLKGLEAVVEVMLDFDDVKESVQSVFTSKAELIPI